MQNITRYYLPFDEQYLEKLTCSYVPLYIVCVCSVHSLYCFNRHSSITKNCTESSGMTSKDWTFYLRRMRNCINHHFDSLRDNRGSVHTFIWKDQLIWSTCSIKLWVMRRRKTREPRHCHQHHTLKMRSMVHSKRKPRAADKKRGKQVCRPVYSRYQMKLMNPTIWPVEPKSMKGIIHVMK